MIDGRCGDRGLRVADDGGGGSSGNSGNSGFAGMSERGGEEGANTAGRWLNSRWCLDGGGGFGRCSGFGRCRIRTEFTVANAELKMDGDARR